MINEFWVRAIFLVTMRSFRLCFQILMAGEEEKCMESDCLSPAENVQQATDCLRAPENIIKGSPKISFQRWTIMDYSRAYVSGEITPLMVNLASTFS